jgi:hypothetical protein
MEANGEIRPTLGIRRVGSAASGNFSSLRPDFAMKKVDDLNRATTVSSFVSRLNFRARLDFA